MKACTEFVHASVVVVDAHHIDIPVVQILKCRRVFHAHQQLSASLNNRILFFLWEDVRNHEFSSQTFHVGLLNIEIISKVFHPLMSQIKYSGFLLVDFQLHVLCQILRYTVAKPHCIISALTKNQYIVCIPNMNANF